MTVNQPIKDTVSPTRKSNGENSDRDRGTSSNTCVQSDYEGGSHWSHFDLDEKSKKHRFETRWGTVHQFILFIIVTNLIYYIILHYMIYYTMHNFQAYCIKSS